MEEFFWVLAKDGLVGQELVHFLKENKHSFIASSHKNADILDINALESFYQKHKPTHLINCAANVHVDLSETTEKNLAYDINVLGTENIAKISKKYNIRCIHISTDYVFDGEKTTDYSETDPTHPINVYGKTKTEGEKRLLSLYPQAVSVRTASLYGSYKEGLVSGMIKDLQEKTVVSHVYDQISSPTYTKDLVQALVDVKDASGIFHYVNTGFCSRFELLQEVYRLCLENKLPIKCQKLEKVSRKQSNRAAIRPKRSVLSTKKIEPYLSFANRSWQDALQEYMQGVLYDKK